MNEELDKKAIHLAHQGARRMQAANRILGIDEALLLQGGELWENLFQTKAAASTDRTPVMHMILMTQLMEELDRVELQIAAETPEELLQVRLDALVTGCAKGLAGSTKTPTSPELAEKLARGCLRASAEALTARLQLEVVSLDALSQLS